MNEFEKNEILTKVSSLLQFCQEIVSRLSSLSSPAPEVKELIKETITEFRDEEQENHDIDCENDLWWDAHYPPSHFYTLVFDDDDVSLYSLDESYANSLLPLDMLENVSTPSDMSRDVMMTDMSRDVVKMPENVLMQSVVQLLHLAAPNAIFNPNWREVQRRKAVHPEFFSLWNCFDSIFSDAKDEDVNISEEAAPDINYHTIDLFNVNSRFINNIPKPNRYPVLGVSPDPDFYHKWYQTGDPYKRSQKFLDPAPFGSLFGYETDIGIVPPPTDPVHGYIWSERYGSFVLHAVMPGRERSSFSKKRG